MATNVIKVTGVSSTGAITSVVVNNTGSGYTWSPTFAFSSSVTAGPPNIITIHGADSAPLMSIMRNGEVVWHQNKPNEAAQKFITVLQGAIDTSAVKSGARERSYLKALEKCVRLLETHDPTVLAAALTQEIQHRRERLTWNDLIDSLETEDDS